MNCLEISDTEFTSNLKLLSKKQLEGLGSIFERKYDLLRSEYQNRLKYGENPTNGPPSGGPLTVEVPTDLLPQENTQVVSTIPEPFAPSFVPSEDNQIIIPRSPGRGRRSPRRQNPILNYE